MSPNHSLPSFEHDNDNVESGRDLYDDRVEGYLEDYTDHLTHKESEALNIIEPSLGSSNEFNARDLLAGISATNSSGLPKLSPEAMASAKLILYDQDGDSGCERNIGGAKSGSDDNVRILNTGLSALRVPPSFHVAQEQTRAWFRREFSHKNFIKSQDPKDAGGDAYGTVEFLDNAANGMRRSDPEEMQAIRTHHNDEEKSLSERNDDSSFFGIPSSKSYHSLFWNKKKLIQVGTFFILFGLTLGFIIMSVSPGEKNKTYKPAVTPLDDFDDSQRMEFLRKIVMKYDSSERFEQTSGTKGTPQHRALQWFATVDYKSNILDEPSLLSRYGLAVLFFATEGQNWTNKQGWLDESIPSDFDVCRWYGITCSPHGHVVGINLAANNMAGYFPLESRFALANVETLDLSSNSEIFYNSLDVSVVWKFATKLETLRLKNTGMSGTISQGLTELSNLQTLDLSTNELTGPLPVPSAWKNIENLDLEFNSFNSTLPDMTSLNLNGNLIQGNVPVWTMQMSSLRDIRLSGNKLTGTVPTRWNSGLVHYEIANNQLEGVLPNMFAGWSSLQYFSASYNKFNGPIPISFSQLGATLQQLKLEVNQMTGEIPDSFSNLKQLSVLKLHENKLEGTVPAGLGEILPLEEVRLHTNELKGSIPNTMCDLEKLQVLTADCLPPKDGSDAKMSCKCCSCF